MDVTDSKRLLILEHEKWFADALALRALNRPKLSIWMILIPVIFVYYFYQYQKFTVGRREFAENYLKSRKRVLDEAYEAVAADREPDVKRLSALSDVPDDVRPVNAEFLGVLAGHYMQLLQAEGADYASLVRSAYRNKTNYLLFLNRLKQAEDRVDAALRPHLEETLEGVEGVIRTIEDESEKLRRETTENIFA